MAVQRRTNFVSQQRVDLPDMRSIESAVSNDFDQLLQGFILSNLEGYVLRGFDIVMTGAIGGAASGLQMNVSNAALFHPFSSQSGTFMVVPTGTPAQTINSAVNTRVSGAFTPSSQNFVGIEYERSIDDTTAAQVYLWDPTVNGETTSVIPRANILNFQIVISTGTWASNVLPIAIVATDAGNNVTSIEDNRRLLFRLGTAGRTAPNPFYSYPWNSQPEGRTESPFISSNNSINPFHGGDKMLFTYKDNDDALKSVIKEMKGSAFWYTAGSSSVGGINLTDLFFDTDSSVLTMRGKFIHSKSTPGELIWTGNLNIRSIIGPLTYLIPANNITLNDGQVAYISLIRNQNFQSTNVFTFNNGSATVAATSLIANIFAGDWIKFFSDNMAAWAQVQSVIGNTITLTAPYVGNNGVGLALRSQGSYTIQIADPDLVPALSDTFWIAKRDDNGTITASISASPTGAVRSGGITTFQTTAPNTFNPGQGVQISGVLDSSFDGFFEILSTPTTSTFTVQNTGPDATSGSGTVNSVATIYLRGIGEVSQGESLSDVSSSITNVIQYIGSSGPTDNQPQYSSTFFVTQNIDLTSAIGQLDTQAGTASLISKQDRNLKLVRGGNWLWTLGTNTLSWDSDAAIQIPGLPESRNNILTGSSVLSSDGMVAYVELNRVAGSPANLTVSTSTISSLVATNNTVIIARRTGNTVLVGSHSFRLIDGQSKPFDAGLSNQNLILIGGTISPITEATSSADWFNHGVQGASERFIKDDDSILDAVANLETEMDVQSSVLELIIGGPGPLLIVANPTQGTIVRGEVLHSFIGNDLINGTYSRIDFQTGNIYVANSLTVRGINFTPVIPAAGMWRWFSVSAIAGALGVDNTYDYQLIVKAASADGASPTAAPKADFSGGAIPLGQIALTSTDGINISDPLYANLVQCRNGLVSQFNDSQFAILNNSDKTKQTKFSVSGTTGKSTTIAFAPTDDRTVTVPDRSFTINRGSHLDSEGSPAGYVPTSDGAFGTTWAAQPGAWTFAGKIANLGLATSVSSNNLTIDLKQADGSTDPSGGAPVEIAMRPTTLTSGSYSIRTATAALSITVPSGATLGSTNGNEFYIYIYLLDNAGTLEMAVSAARYEAAGVITTTAISNTAINPYIMYSTTLRNNVPFRLVGRLRLTEATAGTYLSNVTEIDLNAYNFVEKQFVTSAGSGTTSSTAITSTSFTAFNTTPLLTIRPTRNGYYRVWTTATVLNSVGGTVAVFKITQSGTPATIISEYAVQQSIDDGSASTQLRTNVKPEGIYYLTQGGIFSFVLEARVSAGGSVVLIGSSDTQMSINAQEM